MICLFLGSCSFFPGIVTIFHRALASLSVAEGQPPSRVWENRGSLGGGPGTWSRAARTRTSPEDARASRASISGVRAAVTSPGPREVGRRGLEWRGVWGGGHGRGGPAVPGGCSRGSRRSAGRPRSRPALQCLPEPGALGLRLQPGREARDATPSPVPSAAGRGANLPAATPRLRAPSPPVLLSARLAPMPSRMIPRRPAQLLLPLPSPPLPDQLICCEWLITTHRRRLPHPAFPPHPPARPSHCLPDSSTWLAPHEPLTCRVLPLL